MKEVQFFIYTFAVPIVAVTLLIILFPYLLYADFKMLLLMLAVAVLFRLGAHYRLLKLKSLIKTFAFDIRSQFPKKCQIFVDQDIESTTDIEAVNPGHLLRLMPEDKVPTDGIVTFGSSFLDESGISGNKKAQLIAVGSEISAGSQNRNGSVVYRALARSQDSFSSLLIKNLSDSAVINPILAWSFDALLVLLATFSLWLGRYELGIALLLGTLSVSYLAASQYQRLQLLLKCTALGIQNYFNFQDISRTNILIMDPSPAILSGVFRLELIQPAEGYREETILRFLAPLARQKETGINHAVLLEQRTRNIPLEAVFSFHDRENSVSGIVEDVELEWTLEGDPKFSETEKAFFSETWENAKRKGQAITFLTIKDKIAACIYFSEELQENAALHFQQLKSLGINPVVILPESQRYRESSCRELQIEHVHYFRNANDLKKLEEKFLENKLRPAFFLTDHAGLAPDNCLLITGGLKAFHEKATIAALSLWHPTMEDFFLALDLIRRFKVKCLALDLFYVFSQISLCILLAVGLSTLGLILLVLFNLAFFFLLMKE